MNIHQLREEHPGLYEQLLAQAKQELLAETDDGDALVEAGSKTAAKLSVSDRFNAMSASILSERAENERARLNGQAE